MSRRSLFRSKGTPGFLEPGYLCPSCSYRRAFLARRRIQTDSRTADSPSSPHDTTLGLRPYKPEHVPIPKPVTVFNAPPSTPPAFRRLDSALRSLEKKAAVYINTSQLRLVLRGLESADPVTRIVFLSLENRRGATRLARAILADPLAQETAWERRLDEVADGDGKSILLRYGENFHVDDGNPLVETLSIPSSLLQTHKIEILIQKTSVDNGIATVSELLVPGLETPGYGGRLSLVTYPVHKVMLYADGLRSLPAIGDAQNLGSMVHRVVDGTWSSLQPIGGRIPSITPLNLSLSEEAIGILRSSVKRSSEFERTWFDSGISDVASWLSEGTAASPDSLKSTIRGLVEAHSRSTAQAIQDEEKVQLKDSKASEVPAATKDLMEEGISTWAENAHTELRDRLNSAFLSKSWGKTKWWKLFWRVDEVGFIAQIILNRAWLVDAEKEMIWISGRMQQSGLLGATKLKLTAGAPGPLQKKRGVFVFDRTQRLRDVMDEAKPMEPDEEEPLLIQPWPQNIPFARSALSIATIPPLHALSQTLMLQTISFTFLTSTLSALVYVGISSTSFYEAGAIATAALVFSLRRMQKRWESAREGWKIAIRDDGAEELRKAEQLLRDIVKRGGEVKFDFQADQRRKSARTALDEVQAALDEIPVKDN